MRHIKHYLIVFTLAILNLIGCNSENDKNPKLENKEVKSENPELKSENPEVELEKPEVKSENQEVKSNQSMELTDDFLGNYHGIRESYFMKNQYGDDMIIAGNKVPVPSIDFKFLLKEDNAAGLQQSNLEDNSRYYYDGSYNILNNESDVIKVEVSLSDGQGSNPTYILEINKSNKKGICLGGDFGEPAFEISKTN